MKLVPRIRHYYLMMVVLALSSLVLLVPAKVAADVPPQPEEFYGSVSINGIPAPAGTTITAEISNAMRGSITTTVTGAYGGSATFSARLVVAGQESDIGQPIDFLVNGQTASQTSLYAPGQSQELDLTAYRYPLSASDPQIQKALAYLREAQQPDGDIGGFVTSAWAVMAIAAAGQAPQSWTVGNNSIVSYLAANAAANLDPNKATDWERSILAIVAAEGNPYSFGGINYVSKLLSFYNGNQMGDPTLLNDDVWGILALKAIGQGQQIIPNLLTFLQDHQNSDGGWNFAVGEPSDADDTAATISALLAAGESPSSPVIANAITYLKSQQQSNGGFTSEGSTNSGVTSWAIRAIRDLGQSPVGTGWQQGGNNPVSFLLSLQNPDGSFNWTPSQESNPQWMTAYAIPALLGAVWPKDTLPPVITNPSPAPGSTISSTSPVISASYSDTVSQINTSVAELWLDGTDVTASATVSASGISYNASGLSLGLHTVRVSVSDQAGNSADQTWTFQIVGPTGGSSGGGGGVPVLTPTPSPTPSPLPLGTTSVADVVNNEGIFTQAITIQSQDARCTLTIENGVKGLTTDNQPLTQLTIANMANPPAPPSQSAIIGSVYDLGPDGATFDPPITVTYHYDAADLPPGIAENNLKLAYWDNTNGEWVELPSTVDPQSQTVTASVSHFCAFAVVVQTRPTSFTVSNLTISPAEAGMDDSINVGILVTNAGDVSGTYNADLKVDGTVVQTKAITLAGGDQGAVSFSISGSAPGTHMVSIAGLGGKYTIEPLQSPGTLVIKALTVNSTRVFARSDEVITASLNNPETSPITEDLILKINNVANQTKTVTLAGGASQDIMFTVVEDTPGTYSASINSLLVTFTVEASPETSTATPAACSVPLNWLLVVGLVVGALVIALLILLLVRQLKK